MSQVRLLNDREAEMQHAKRSHGKKTRAGRRSRKHARKSNSYEMSAPKGNRAHRRAHRRSRRHKRNDAGSGSLGMRIAKIIGIVVGGMVLTLAATLALSSTSLSTGVQDGILIAGALVLGVAAFAWGKPALAAGLAAPMLALPMSRRILVWGITARVQALVSQVQTAVTPATTTAAPAANPSGWAALTPSWTPQLAQNANMGGSFVNMGVPMGAMSGSYG